MEIVRLGECLKIVPTCGPPTVIGCIEYILYTYLFSKFGQVKHVRMNLGNTGRPGAGFGFVTFAKEEAAREALQNKDNIFFNKLQLNIEEKKTRVRHPSMSHIYVES